MTAHRIASNLLSMMGVVWHTLASGTIVLGTAVGEWRFTTNRVRKVAALLVDPRTHFRVANVLRRRELRPIAKAAPLLTFKYLTDYLKTGFSPEERARILIHHYSVLSRRAEERFFRAITGDGLELWRETLGGHDYRIVLTFPHEMHSEGDLSLVFRAGTTLLYTLSFTIGPGAVARSDASDVMFVGRVQGKGGALDRIRSATKDCFDISPAALLLSAAEGIAMELNLARIIGVGGGSQLSAGLSRPGGLNTAYDAFWIAAGAERLDGDIYALTVPLTEKPLPSIRRCHRSRVRRKRAFRRLVREASRARFRESSGRDDADATRRATPAS